MFSAKIIAILLSLRALLIPCCPPQQELSKRYHARAYTRMPAALAESSGLEHAGGGSFWTMRDSGGPAALYRIGADGQLLDTLSLPLRNIDWEDLARDTEGNLYIGDFGNNQNRRRNLMIYRLSATGGKVDTIQFHWEDQQNFPPPKEALNYDCEAFFWHAGKLHLFTKSRGDGYVRHYSVPDQPGTYAAELLESTFVKDLVTAADISPDGSTIALLTYGKVYLFAVKAPDAHLQQALGCIRIPGAGQSEAILFINNTSILVGNETRKLIFLQLGN
ncbi:hypothetical protein [Cesiribacter sp. SM1]|uniref:hypothetical protein n=1 Tax=Cesiribacter sp. SM1 TaxID=2861196 RepID=UPI001CD55B42|nr:hypothetical protein [Cesiribacter sp. SM1]